MASSTSYRICLCFRRRFEGASNEPPEAIKEVFDRYADNGVMGPDQLRRFLMEEQGEDEASAAAAAAAAAAEGHHLGGMFHARKGGLSLDAFFQYLFREDNHPLVSHSLQVHQDMRAPLSHYFIYTGHNSYLTGNQLSSDCSDVPIIEALEKGVRVIELDLWPNSGKDDVHVLHGRTLTAPVDLLKCLESIKEHAFSASPYPVILTLEDHLTPNLQAKVAQMLTQVFGKMLYRPDSECSPKALACPEDLKMRVVVSTKPPKEYLESKVPTVDTGAQEHKDSVSSPDKKVLWGKEVSDLKLKLSGDSPNKGDTIDEDGEAIDQYEEEDADEVEDADESQAQTEAVEYKNLIAIKATKRKRNLSETLKVEPGVATRISLSEQMFEKATKSHGTELIRFTQQNLLRIFPKSTRFDSSNYNPFLGWMYGAQMVAFNMQSHGRDLWLMEGMFRANGGCGYVKKPDMLLKGSECDMVLDPKIELQVKMTLKVKVYMGDGWRMDFHRTHFDTFSPPDFYARVGIAGVPGDCVMKRTKAVEDSWRPVWGEEFEFPLTVPELAVMRIEVHEYDMSDKDDFGGQTCLPVWELRPGIRAVQLHGLRGHKYNNVRLLMRFHFS